MRAGKLRHRITIERPIRSQDSETGEVIQSWQVAWEKIPASVEPLSGRDLIAAQAVQSESSARMVIRYRPGVLPGMRILYRGDVYNIQGPALPDPVSGLEYLTILVAKGVNDG